MNKNKTLIVLSVTLFLSLSGNMFFLGLLLGSANYNSIETTTDFMEDNSLQTAQIKSMDTELKQQLPKSDISILKSHMSDLKPMLKGQKKAMTEARRAVRKAMGAKNFDQNELNKALENQRIQRKKMQDMINKMRHRISSDMSFEGRQAFTRIEDRWLRNQEERKLFKDRDKTKRNHESRKDRLERIKKMREQRRKYRQE